MKKQKATKKIPEKILSEQMVPFLDEVKRFMHAALRESERSVKEDLKDFVRSTAKGTEAVLGKRIDKVEKKVDSLGGEVKSLKMDVKQLQVAVLGNRKDIKEIRKDMQDMRTELKGEIKSEGESIRSDLKKEIRDSEERLGNKIDKNAIRLDDHATRITTLE